MKQLWQSISTGQTSVIEVPVPIAARGQILVRVSASLISAGTERTVVEFAEKSLVQKALARPDLVKQMLDKAKREGWIATIEAARNRMDTGMALGYSNAGTVIEVGEGVIDFRVGDRVACAGGGYATHSEIVRVPRNLAAGIPSGKGMRDIPFDEAAFATVGAIALHGVRLAELQLGSVVAVIGLGLIGQIAVQLIRANGCVVVGMDPSRDRGTLAEQMGCVATAASDEEMELATARLSGGRGADAVLIAAATRSDSPVALAAKIARDRAIVVAVGDVGISLPRKLYYMKELDFRVSRSYGPGRYDPEYEEKGNDYPIGYIRWTEGRNLSSILQLLADHRLDFAPLITHRFPIEDAEKGYDLISGKTGEPFLGVVITYANQPSMLRRIELPHTSPSSTSAPGAVRLGMIGAGLFATGTLIPAIKAAGGIALIGICASGGSSARAAAFRYRFNFCASDEKEIYSSDVINTIAICTRHGSHAGQVIAALNAGKHVFCEKPLAMNVQQLRAILEAVKRSTTRPLLMVGYNRRFSPFAKTLREFLLGIAEPLVMTYRVNAGFIPADHWTQDSDQGGGRLLGEVCHFIDFLSFLCGHHVVSVSGSFMPNSGRYSDDNLASVLRFADGSIGTITYVANGDKSFSKERVEVFSQGRVAVLDDFRVLHIVENGKSRSIKSRLRIDKGHLGEWQAFAHAVSSGGNSPISLPELVNSTLATFALLRACTHGCRVDLTIDGLTSRIDQSDPAPIPERG